MAILFMSAPMDGDFRYSDASRHALNGAFYLDAISHFPWQDPIGYAEKYYQRYPALTILFYPPLMHLSEAAFYAVFGVSHWVAQLTVSAYYLLGAFAAFYIARLWLLPLQALATTIVFIALPEMALWGRQVMLDIPALAFLLWCFYFLFRDIREPHPKWLYLMLMAFVLGLYTKQTIAFAAPVLFAGAWLSRGKHLLTDRHAWQALLIAAIATLPLIAITLKFGGFNAVSVAQGDGLGDHSQLDLGFYLAALPQQAGWLLPILAACSVIWMAIRRQSLLPRKELAVVLLWFIVGYVFFSAIRLHATRFDLPILFPMVLLAMLWLNRIFPHGRANAIAVVMAVGMFLTTLAWHPVPSVKGYKQASDVVAERAATASTVLFSGHQDGTFIFNIRAHENRSDLSVIRADKLFFKVNVSRAYGMDVISNPSAEDIALLLDESNIDIVVSEPGFWLDQAPMRTLSRVLNDPARFRIVTRIPIDARVWKSKGGETELVIYERIGQVGTDPIAHPKRKIELPIIGRTIGNS
ncbi:MAG: glycosyltransferase family 39 protein [Gammaproteobacteria bacterium]|nr:glycosyltransferase family 39 protein [Gammaproteobacteria bacterium]